MMKFCFIVGRCYEYFVESIHSDIPFKACKCDENAWDPEGDDHFSSCSCENNGSVDMGEWVPLTASGIYFLTTNSESPFVIRPETATH